MLRNALFCSALAIASSNAFAAPGFYLTPQQGGAEIEVPATVRMDFPNDKATIFFYTLVESDNLLDVQSKVNASMAEAQKVIKDFSSIAKIENAGYTTEPIYNNPAEGQARQIVGWKARQSIKVETEDVQGVSALVQIVQGANIALSNVSFSLTPETREAAESKLIAASVDSLNKKAALIAQAMKLPSESVRVVKLNFGGDFAETAQFAPRMFMAKSANALPAAPNFEVGTTTLSLSINASLKLGTKTR